MAARDYPAALDALSSLITQRRRADGSNRGDAFELMLDYLQILDFEKSLSELSVIHIAGTKGKGSTCTFSENILRACGYKTGLFISPHLIDVRERFCINGLEVSEDVFLNNFWWCWDRLKANCTGKVPLPAYFRFLTLLAFKIFISEKVDVAILEVGLGGKFDATNVVKAPTVCGISSLGFDHMQILGHTLPEIAGEKAGIFKSGVPAFTVPQPEDAMAVLQKCAAALAISLEIVQPLEVNGLQGLHLGLAGNHQHTNAALAVALCIAWTQRRGYQEHIAMVENASSKGHLPEPYIKGLASAQLPGRAQLIQDPLVKGMTFFLDGAHSPESMEACASWFCSASNIDHATCNSLNQPVVNDYEQKALLSGNCALQGLGEKALSRRILLFNCMPERDPMSLIPPLLNICKKHGIPFHRAIFVPGYSSYSHIGSRLSANSSENSKDAMDLSWQCLLQRTWESLMYSSKNKGNNIADVQQSLDSIEQDFAPPPPSFLVGINGPDGHGNCDNSGKVYRDFSSAVLPSIPTALKLLRQCADQNPSLHLQVLVTGSLHLVGDVLRLLKR